MRMKMRWNRQYTFKSCIRRSLWLVPFVAAVWGGVFWGREPLSRSESMLGCNQ